MPPETPAYALRMISFWLYQRGITESIIDPKGMGREKADDIVHFSKTKEDIFRDIRVAEEESKLSYLTNQHRAYYLALINELKSYVKKDERALDLYRM